MKQINSAYWVAMQADNPDLCELIELSVPTQAYFYTTCNAPVISSGNIYDPLPGNLQSGQEESMDFGIGVLNFAFANSGSILGDILFYHGLDVSSIRVDRVFINSPDLGRDIMFIGQAGDVSYDRSQANIQARNIWGTIQKDWPVYNYENNCVWRFGSPGCGINTSSLTISGSIDASSSTRLLIHTTSEFLTQSYANGYMDMGRLTINTGVNSGERRTVRVHSGDIIGLSHSLPHSIDALEFSIFPGCRKTLVRDCTSKYNNSSAFLGIGKWAPKQERAF
jgi:hypothetical protein